MKKKIIALALILVLASIAFTYFAEASILYQDIPYQFKKIGGQWFTIDRINNLTGAGTYTTVQCQDKGFFDGAFSIIANLKNAAFTDSTSQQAIINRTTTKIIYVLRTQEKTSSNLYFVVDPNATKFEVSIALQTNQLFLRSDIPGMYPQATFQYYVSSNDTWSASEIWSPVQIA